MSVTFLQSGMIVFAFCVPGVDGWVHATCEAEELHPPLGAGATGEFEDRCETVTAF